MPNIRPISDLCDYSTVLKDVAVGQPVHLTQNGRGKYAIVDIADQERYEGMEAELKLLRELEKGRIAGEEKGWLTSDTIRAHMRSRRKEEAKSK